MLPSQHVVSRMGEKKCRKLLLSNALALARTSRVDLLQCQEVRICSLPKCPEGTGKPGTAEHRKSLLCILKSRSQTSIRLTQFEAKSQQNNAFKILKENDFLQNCVSSQTIRQMRGQKINIFRGTKSQNIYLLSFHFRKLTEDMLHLKRE